MKNPNNEELIINHLHKMTFAELFFCLLTNVTVKNDRWTVIQDIEKELLSRLNRLDEVEKENKELKESIRHWEGSRDGVLQSMTEQEHKYLLVCENYVTLQKENAELRTQVENLKCCGNCRINCNCESFFRGWHKYCDQWQADSMTREEREK